MAEEELAAGFAGCGGIEGASGAGT